MNLLHTIGLMTRAEHERIVQAEILQSIKAANRASDEKGFRFKAEKRADELEAKFKRAVTDLAAQAEEIAEWKTIANDLGAIVEATKDDARKWRDYLKRSRDRKAAAADRKRMAGKRGKA